MRYTTLKKRSDFLRVAAAKNLAKTKTVWVQFFPSNNAENKGVHVGFTASRKVGNAVKRNRSKRRLRALVSTNLPDFLTKYSLLSGDFVFIALSQTADCLHNDLVCDFLYALNKCINKSRPSS
jgi:ribonuclease P protein component